MKRDICLLFALGAILAITPVVLADGADCPRLGPGKVCSCPTASPCHQGRYAPCQLRSGGCAMAAGGDSTAVVMPTPTIAVTQPVSMPAPTAAVTQPASTPTLTPVLAVAPPALAQCPRCGHSGTCGCELLGTCAGTSTCRISGSGCTPI